MNLPTPMITEQERARLLECMRSATSKHYLPGVSQPDGYNVENDSVEIEFHGFRFLVVKEVVTETARLFSAGGITVAVFKLHEYREVYPGSRECPPEYDFADLGIKVDIDIAKVVPELAAFLARRDAENAIAARDEYEWHRSMAQQAREQGEHESRLEWIGGGGNIGENG
jgi:hypothetical protein